MSACRILCIHTFATLFFVLSPAFASFTAIAQAPGQSFGVQKSGPQKSGMASPYQQRLSPYLDLLRTDNSALGPYHTFVRPQKQLRQTANAQASQLRQLQQAMQRQQRGHTSPQRMQTGRGATFNNYGHFYQFQTN